jgi:alcohol dehydrogenase class IV
MLPKVAVVDPELTISLPPEQTASSGMDALTQVLEPFVSRKANPLVDLFCKEGLSCAADGLLPAYTNGDNLDARRKMAWASLLGGLALANTGLGAVHSFAGPLGGLYAAPHGALCAALLAPVVRVNVETLQSNQPDHPALQRYLQIAQILTSDPMATIEMGIRWLEDITQALHIPGLHVYGVVYQDFPTIVEKAAASSSMRGNPAELTSAEMVRMLEMAL